MRRTTLGLASLALACSPSTPPPAPRPVVQPERPVDAGLVADAPPVVAAAPPAEGPCALALPGGVEAAGLVGRIDHLQLAASEGAARLVAELSGPGAPSRASTVSVDVDVAGASSPPVTVTVGAQNARVVATAVSASNGLRTLAFGDRYTAVDGADFDNAHRFVLAGGASEAVRSHQALLHVDELAVASGSERFVAAYAGTMLECYGPLCHGSDRTGGWGMVFRPHSYMEVGVVLFEDGRLRHEGFDGIGCESIGGDIEVRVTPYWVRFGDTPADRCRMVRRQRPFDVAIATHGTSAFVVWRTATTVQGAAVTEEGREVDEARREAERTDERPGPEGESDEERQAREERDYRAAEARAMARKLLATGDVGAPTVAYRGDAAIVMWPQRANPRAPYSLRYVEWSHPDTTPPPRAPRTLATGAASAFAPALAAVGDRLVLTWTEGDDRNAAVRVSSTALGVNHLADHAVTVSAPTANARDPELAVSGDRAWIAWSEYPANQRRDQGRGRVRVSPLRLP